MKKLTFAGYYGMQNYGDDLFGLISLYGARKYWPQTRARVLAPKISSSNISDAFSVPSFVSADLYINRGLLGKMVRGYFAGQECLLRNGIVFSGGSLFSSEASGLRSFFNKFSKKNPHFFSGIGISVGPFATVADEKEAVDFLGRFLYISVRDKESFEILNSRTLGCKVELGRDLAGMGSKIFQPKVTTSLGEGLCIGYAPCAFGGSQASSTGVNKTIVSALAERAKCRKVKVVVLALNENPTSGDRALCDFSVEALQTAGVEVELIRYSELGVESTWHLIANCSAFISGRLHGAISAYVSGTPFCLYEYHQKCKNFLDDIGQPENLRIRENDANPLAIATVINRLLDESLAPSLNRLFYAAEAEAAFTKAPWASSVVGATQ